MKLKLSHPPFIIISPPKRLQALRTAPILISPLCPDQVHLVHKALVTRAGYDYIFELLVTVIKDEVGPVDAGRVANEFDYLA
jgi:hypothetical protein